MKGSLGHLTGSHPKAPQRTPAAWLSSCTGRADPAAVPVVANSLRTQANLAPVSLSLSPSTDTFSDRPSIALTRTSVTSALGCHTRTLAAAPHGRGVAVAAAAANIATSHGALSAGNAPASLPDPSEADDLLLLQPSELDADAAFPLGGSVPPRSPHPAGLSLATAGPHQPKRPTGPTLLQRPAAPGAAAADTKKRATPSLLPVPGGFPPGQPLQMTADEQRLQEPQEQVADVTHGSIVTQSPRSDIDAAASPGSPSTSGPTPASLRRTGGRDADSVARAPEAASGASGLPGGTAATSDNEAAARLASVARRSSGGAAGPSQSRPVDGEAPGGAVAPLQRRRRPQEQPRQPQGQVLFSDEDPVVAAAFDSLTVSVSGRAPPAPLLSYNDLTRGPREVPKLLLRNAAAGFQLKRPTPIQSHVVPAILEGRDVLAVSCTGSGKTLSYLLPVLAQLMGRNRVGTKNSASPEALVLVPTRELAEQVYADVRVLLRGSHLKALAVHGGVSIAEQVLAMRGRFKRSAGGVDLLVATPGRLLQLVEQRRAVRLGRLGLLVVDEADRMMDLGMWPDLRRLLSQPGLPTARQTVLVAAAMPRPELGAAAAELLRDQVAVAVGDGSGTSAAVRQVVELVTDETKLDRLTQLLAPGAGSGVVGLAAAAAAGAAAAPPAAPAGAASSSSPPPPGPSPTGRGAVGAPSVVFTRSLRRAEEVARHLAARGVSVALLHRDLTQDQRDEAMQCFRFGVTSVLVATAMASRGLNFPDVAHVINYDVPATSSIYMHQVGRTGRGGRPGLATTLVTSSNRPAAPWLQVALQRANCPVPPWLNKMAAEARDKAKALRAAAATAAAADPAAVPGAAAAAAPAAPPLRRRTAVALDDPGAASAIRFGSYVGVRPSQQQQQVRHRGGSDVDAGGDEARRRAAAAAASAAAVDGAPLPPLQPVVRDRRHDVEYWQAVFDSALQPLNTRPVPTAAPAAAAAAAAPPRAGRSRRRQQPAAQDDDFSVHPPRNQAAAAGMQARRGEDAQPESATHGSEDVEGDAAEAAPAARHRRKASSADGSRGAPGGRLLFRDGAVELAAQPGVGLTAGPGGGLGR